MSLFYFHIVVYISFVLTYDVLLKANAIQCNENQFTTCIKEGDHNCTDVAKKCKEHTLEEFKEIQEKFGIECKPMETACPENVTDTCVCNATDFFMTSKYDNSTCVQVTVDTENNVTVCQNVTEVLQTTTPPIECRPDQEVTNKSCEYMCDPKTFDYCKDNATHRCMCKLPMMRDSVENDTCITGEECKEKLGIHYHLELLYPQKVPCPPGEQYRCVLDKPDGWTIRNCEKSCTNRDAPSCSEDQKNCVAMGCMCSPDRYRYFEGMCLLGEDCTKVMLEN